MTYLMQKQYTPEGHPMWIVTADGRFNSTFAHEQDAMAYCVMMGNVVAKVGNGCQVLEFRGKK